MLRKPDPEISFSIGDRPGWEAAFSGVGGCGWSESVNCGEFAIIRMEGDRGNRDREASGINFPAFKVLILMWRADFGSPRTDRR